MSHNLLFELFFVILLPSMSNTCVRTYSNSINTDHLRKKSNFSFELRISIEKYQVCRRIPSDKHIIKMKKANINTSLIYLKI